MGLLGLLPVLIVERARSSVLVLELVGLAVTVVVGCARCCGCFRCYRCGGGVAIAVVVVFVFHDLQSVYVMAVSVAAIDDTIHLMTTLTFP